jgi:hypothetical protein
MADFFMQVAFSKSGCWLWRGSIDTKGYGSAFGTSAHRATYQWFVGPLANTTEHGIVVDHLCRVHNCVNPDHLEQVTIGENNRRGIPFRTHCRNGLHPRVGNWQHGRGRNSSCAKCHVLRQRAYEARKAARRQVAA